MDRSPEAGSLSPREKLAILSEIGTLVISEPLHQVLDRIVRAAQRLTTSDDCTVFLFDYQRDELVASRHRGTYEEEAETVRLRVGEEEDMDPVARAHRLGRPVHRRQGVQYARGWQAESLVSVPILASHKKLGVLCACRQTADAQLTEEDEAFLRNLASYAAVAIEHDSQREEAKRSAEALSELYSVTQSLHSDRDLQAVLKGCVSGALKVSKATAALLYLYDHEADDVEIPPIIEGDLRQPEVVEEKNVQTDHRRSVVFRVLQRREPFYAENAVEDWVRAGLYVADNDPQRSFIGREGIASSAAIPLHGSRYPVGVLFINYRKPQTFTRATRERIELFAEQAARHIRFQQHAKRHLTSLQTLNEIGNVISAGPTPDVRRICQLVHAQTARLMDVTNFFVCLYDEERRTYQFAHMEDEFDRPEQFAPHDLTRGLTARVQQTEQPLLVNESNRAEVRRQVGSVVGREAACWLGVPMIARGKFRGVIAVQSYDDAAAYSEEDRELLSTIALQTAVTIDNAQRLGAAEQRSRELKAMCQALERIADPYDRPDNLLPDLVQLAAETCSAPAVALYGHRTKTKEHWLACAYPAGTEPATFHPGATDHVERVLATPKTHIDEKALCAPMIVEGECIGAVLLLGRDFARSDRELVERFAELTAIVMHHVAKARFRSTVVQALPRPMIAIDPSGRVKEFNAGSSALLGYAPESILGRDVINLYWKGLEEARRIKKLLHTRGSITFEPSVLCNDQGQKVEVKLSASMLRDEDGNEIGSVAIIEATGS